MFLRLFLIFFFVKWLTKLHVWNHKNFWRRSRIFRKKRRFFHFMIISRFPPSIKVKMTKQILWLLDISLFYFTSFCVKKATFSFCNIRHGKNIVEYFRIYWQDTQVFSKTYIIFFFYKESFGRRYIVLILLQKLRCKKTKFLFFCQSSKKANN